MDVLASLLNSIPLAEGMADLMMYKVGAAIGAGLTIIGVGLGLGRLGGSAMEAIARQPEATGDIRGGMILMAALVEGTALLSLIICILAVLG